MTICTFGVPTHSKTCSNGTTHAKRCSAAAPHCHPKATPSERLLLLLRWARDEQPALVPTERTCCSPRMGRALEESASSEARPLLLAPRLRMGPTAIGRSIPRWWCLPSGCAISPAQSLLRDSPRAYLSMSGSQVTRKADGRSLGRSSTSAVLRSEAPISITSGLAREGTLASVPSSRRWPTCIGRMSSCAASCLVRTRGMAPPRPTAFE